MPRDYDDEDHIVRESDLRRDFNPSSEDRQMAMFTHPGGIIGGFIVPLIIWLVKKDTSRFVADQGREALNYQLTMMIAQLVAIVITVATCGLGFPLMLAIAILTIVYCCIGGAAANRGEAFRYPSWMMIRMIS